MKKIQIRDKNSDPGWKKGFGSLNSLEKTLKDNESFLELPVQSVGKQGCELRIGFPLIADPDPPFQFDAHPDPTFYFNANSNPAHQSDATLSNHSSADTSRFHFESQKPLNFDFTADLDPAFHSKSGSEFSFTKYHRCVPIRIRNPGRK
jgi:hypothetical protein